MWRKSREEKRDYMNLTWLNHQYYDLGRSLQDIADDQGVSMMIINKWVDKIEKQSYVKTEEKSFKTCPSCKLKLNLNVKFCFNCGKKVEEVPPIPVVSEMKEEKGISEIPQIKTEEIQLPSPISEKKEEITIAEIPLIKDEEGQQKLSKSDRWEEKLMPKILDLTVEKIQKTPSIKEERQVTKDSLSETEEKQPVPPVLDVKVDILEKLKNIIPICKFCGMELSRKAPFCPQCGSRVKKK